MTILLIVFGLIFVGALLYKLNHWMLFAMHETTHCPHCNGKTVAKFDKCIHSACGKFIHVEKVVCPSCEKSTLFNGEHKDHSNCSWCDILILEEADGSLRAHVAKAN